MSDIPAIDTDGHVLESTTTKARHARWWFATFLITAFVLSVAAHAGQKDLQKLTVGYTPISGASISFFIAVEERIFQKYGFEVAPVFMGGRRSLIRRSLLGNFPLVIREAVLSSRAASRGVI